jgi:hypothetical protein
MHDPPLMLDKEKRLTHARVSLIVDGLLLLCNVADSHVLV